MKTLRNGQRKKNSSIFVSNYNSLHTICHDFVCSFEVVHERSSYSIKTLEGKKPRVHSTHHCAIQEGKTSNAVSLCDVNLICLIEK